MPPDGVQRRIDGVTATGLIIASMVGVGVFTTTGLLIEVVPSPMGILLCWTVGGLAALCGALAYAELGAALSNNGGEYYYLSRLFHPVVGFLSAWVSLIVGFCAPLAAIAVAFGEYLAVFVPGLPPQAAGATLIVLLCTLHIWRISTGSGFQNLFTIAKIALIAVFVVVGWYYGDVSRLSGGSQSALSTVVSPGFAGVLGATNTS